MLTMGRVRLSHSSLFWTDGTEQNFVLGIMGNNLSYSQHRRGVMRRSDKGTRCMRQALPMIDWAMNVP